MSVFNVAIPVSGVIYISTETDDVSKAIDKAITEIVPDDLHDVIDRGGITIEEEE